MKANELLKLAERVEGLTGPDRKINADILRALGWTTSGWDAIDPAGNRAMQVPDFLSSIDAAMSLVPDAHWATFDPHFLSDPGVVKYRGYTFRADWVRWTPHDDWIERDEGNPLCATPALAICAAALRAHASAMEGEG